MKNEDFNQRFGFAAPKCWSKYTTSSSIAALSENNLKLNSHSAVKNLVGIILVVWIAVYKRNSYFTKIAKFWQDLDKGNHKN